MLRINRILFLFFAGILSITAYGEEIRLHCRGAVEGTDIRRSPREFSMSIDSVSGEVWGMPKFIVPSFTDNAGKITGRCIMSKNDFTCTGSNHRGVTNLRLLRSTGSLEIVTFFKDNNSWEGIFSCQKTENKF
jgi:hypothetical protein